MLHLAFILFSLQFLSARINPLIDAFNFSVLNDGNGHLISGTLKIVVDLNGLIISDTSGPTIMIVDPPRHRMYFDLSGAAGGKFALFANRTTYNWNNLEFSNGEGCAVVPDFGYDDEVAGFHFLKATAEFGNEVVYGGNAYDSNGCGRPIGVTISEEHGFVHHFLFSQAYNLYNPQAKVFFCAMVQGYMEFNRNSVVQITSSNLGYIDSFFALPSSCSTNPVDFCSSTYGPGNPCDALEKGSKKRFVL